MFLPCSALNKVMKTSQKILLHLLTAEVMQRQHGRRYLSWSCNAEVSDQVDFWGSSNRSQVFPRSYSTRYIVEEAIRKWPDSLGSFAYEFLPGKKKCQSLESTSICICTILQCRFFTLANIFCVVLIVQTAATLFYRWIWQVIWILCQLTD